MTEQTVVALLGALGVVGAAAVTGVGVVLGLLWRRITQLEAELHRRHQFTHELWFYLRALVDLYYRWRRADAPDLPPPPTEEENAA